MTKDFLHVTLKCLKKWDFSLSTTLDGYRKGEAFIYAITFFEALKRKVNQLWTQLPFSRKTGVSGDELLKWWNVCKFYVVFTQVAVYHQQVEKLRTGRIWTMMFTTQIRITLGIIIRKRIEILTGGVVEEEGEVEEVEVSLQIRFCCFWWN